jgi:hypothetical protein
MYERRLMCPRGEESSRRILLDDNLGGFAVTLWQIVFNCVGVVLILDRLSFLYSVGHV